MLVSVIICLHNEAINIAKRAIDSVAMQVGLDFEVCIVDDSGAYRYKEFISKEYPSFKYLPVNYLNNSKSLNYAISTIETPYIAILDGDDEWIVDTKLKGQISYLQNNPEICMLSSWVEVSYPDGGSFIHAPSPTSYQLHHNLLIYNPICHSSVILRHSALSEVRANFHTANTGPYDESLFRGKDLDLFLKIRHFGRLEIFKEVTTRYYTNQNNKRLSDAYVCLQMCLRHQAKYSVRLKALLYHGARYFIFLIMDRPVFNALFRK